VCGVGNGTVAKVNEGQFVTIACTSPTDIIQSITFANYGTPNGTCGSYQQARRANI
jgi:hypothetical protein